MEKLPFLMFREHSSLEYALLISEKSSYKGAARDVTYTSVPGLLTVSRLSIRLRGKAPS